MLRTLSLAGDLNGDYQRSKEADKLFQSIADI
jgi:hypothetical protein